MIEGITPCRPELLEIIEALVAEFEGDELEDGLPLTFEQDNLNPNMFSVAVLDDDGYANAGLVGWVESKGQICFYCHQPLVENHDSAEGVPEEESKAWWQAPSLEMFIMFLDGTVREIVTRDIKNSLTESA